MHVLVVLWLMLPDSLHIGNAVIEGSEHLATGFNFSLKSMVLVTRVVRRGLANTVHQLTQAGVM